MTEQAFDFEAMTQQGRVATRADAEYVRIADSYTVEPPDPMT